MTSLASYFAPRAAAEPSPEDRAVELGAAARRLYEDYKASEIDAFALRLAAEKKAKNAGISSQTPSKVGGKIGMSRGGMKGGFKTKGGGGVASMIPMKKSDLSWNPADINKVPKSIPKNITSQIIWVVQKFPGATVTLSTSVVSESNTFVTISNLPGSTNYLACFDQYHIFMFTQAWYPEYPSGATAAAAELHSALDIDNTTTLGTLALIDKISSSEVAPLRQGGAVMRSIRPCVAETAGSTANSTVERRWMDSAFTAVPHYGLRFIFSVAGSAFTVRSEVTMVVAFRSPI